MNALASAPRWSWLPPVGTWKYHALLLALGIGVLGPLGGVTASFMNFSLGFFIGGQVLAGILGSTVTYGYGPEGKHGANYMQTAAASVASLSAMGVMIQAMVWMGLPQPPVWQLVLFMLCTGMFAVGVGMLYTPLLVDRMQLTYPSGLAVANILRALPDPVLLKKSVARLGGGMAAGVAGGLGSAKIAALGTIELSTSTMGAGMLVGARIGIPAITSGLIFWALTPWFVSIGWLKEGEPFRKIAFLIALGMILGAALIDVALVLKAAAARLGEKKPADDTPEWKRVNTARLVAWVAFWGAGVVASSHFVLGQPVGFIALALFLVFVFALVNGISVGVCDQNPISSAFVVSVVLMAALGLKDPITGLFAGMILLIATNCAADMQQDRSTGWRLGTNRVHQFRYQVAGIAMGAVAAVVFAKLFMAAYPVLLLDQTVMKASEQPAQWSAAMTYKVVGVLRSLTDDQPYQRTAIWVGVAFGFVVQVLRLWLKALPSYQAFIARDRKGFVTGFVVDAFVLPTPYAFSFGGFVNLPTSLWFGAGGLLSSFLNTIAKPKAGEDGDLPSDMNTTSLVGGGLIAGDSLAALGLGIAGLLALA
ncbi:MAG: OPT/YSL family transporter [Betaproteobacteria bacterium]|nr:OPT/YSL family transporter [Betaproteobacteria bacterium]